MSNIAFTSMRIWIRFLVAALGLWQSALAQGASVTERLQWNDPQGGATLTAQMQPAWQAAQEEIHRGLESGTLWVRLRVVPQGRDDLYLRLRKVTVEDLAVGVQTLTSADQAQDAPMQPGPMVPITALDVRDGKLLLPGAAPGDAELIVWIRARGERARWFEVDVLDAAELTRQRVLDGAITGMQLTFSALVVLTSLVQYLLHRKPIFGTVAALGLLSALYYLQRSGAFIGLFGPDLAAFTTLNTSSTLLLGGTGLYASAAVAASPRFKLLYQRTFSLLLCAALLMTVLAQSTAHAAFHLAAVGFLVFALYVFCADCVRQWLQHRSWRQGLVNRVMSLVFVVVLSINLSVLCHLFAPSLHLPWADTLRAFNLPMLSVALLLTLVWRQQRAQSVKVRRRRVNLQKLQEQISIRLLQQQFIAMLVHEIKTPLTVVQLGANALAKTDVASDRKQAWNLRMHTAIKSIVHILDNCSQAERYEGGVMAVAPVQLPVLDVLDMVRQHALNHASELPERLQLQCEESLEGLQLHTDQSYFQIILNNLVGNALKYSLEASTVHVNLSQVHDAQGAPMLQVAVRNAIGPWGSPAPDKVFSRYYRSENAGSVSGTGLGLWLSQQLAERLGSKIHFSLEADQAVFWFALPLRRDAVQMPDAQPTGPMQMA